MFRLPDGLNFSHRGGLGGLPHEMMSKLVHVKLHGLLAAALYLYALSGMAAGGSAVLTASDAEVQVVRGDQSLTAGSGFRLQPGDIICLHGAHSAQIEIGTSYAVALGAGANLMLDRVGTSGPEALHLLVLAGWVKVAPLGDPGTIGVVLDTPELRAHVPAGSAILAVEASRTRLFSEGSTPRVGVPEPDGRAGKEVALAREQLAVRSERQPLELHPRPDKDFVTSIPVEMRDPLPALLASALRKPLLGKTPSAPITYEAVAPWLDAPPRLRHGMVARFRPRITDPAFRAALERDLARHPEWKDILHPPAPLATTVTIGKGQ